MTRWQRCARALPMTFLVYASSLVLSVALAFPIARELERLPNLPGGPLFSRILLLEHVVAFSPLWRSQAATLLIATAAYGLLSPWLQMAWLLALSQPIRVGKALGSSVHRVPHALIVSICVGVATTLCLLLWLFAAWVVHGELEVSADARTLDLSTWATCIPCIPTAIVGLAWHDLARARCLTQHGLSSVFRSLPDAFRPMTLARYAGLAGVGLALGLGAQAHAVQLPATDPWVLSMAAVQALFLLRSTLRSVWLLEALALAAPNHAGGAP